MKATIIKMTRKPRPLTKTYYPDAPYVVRRKDYESGTITYDIMDERPDSYRFVCGISDDYGSNGYAKHDAEQIARALNLMVQLGKEILPKAKP